MPQNMKLSDILQTVSEPTVLCKLFAVPYQNYLYLKKLRAFFLHYTVSHCIGTLSIGASLLSVIKYIRSIKVFNIHINHNIYNIPQGIFHRHVLKSKLLLASLKCQTSRKTYHNHPSNLMIVNQKFKYFMQRFQRNRSHETLICFIDV